MLLVVLWAGLLVAFLVVGPRPSSAVFWLLIGAAIGVGGLYMLVAHRDSSRTQREWRKWSWRVAELVDVDDYVDDGHLFESLDDEERESVVAELTRMPAGSRSLRRALELVCPEMLDARPGHSAP